MKSIRFTNAIGKYQLTFREWKVGMRLVPYSDSLSYLISLTDRRTFFTIIDSASSESLQDARHVPHDDGGQYCFLEDKRRYLDDILLYSK
jgi:hypothetical protein